MSYTLANVFKYIEDAIEVVYLVDKSSDSYITLKDNELFHGLFGDEGSYRQMLDTFTEYTVDSQVAKTTPYGIFSKDCVKYTGAMSSNARLRIDNKQVLLAIKTIPLDAVKEAILITQLRESEYIQDIHKDQQMNAIKSAFLFSMSVDLDNDMCGNICMSEISDMPATQPALPYSEWRNLIVNMFLEEERKHFLNITDPDYVRCNLTYGASKSWDCQMMNLEGKYIWVKIIFSRINTGNDNEFRFLFMVEDIHESHNILMEDLKKLESLVNKDSLTGLYNHGSIESEISNSIERCKEEKKPASLIMFDIDHFKQINDTYGHASGDYVLKTLSSIASKHFKEYGGKLGRWGGEEFICVCENTTVDKMEKITESLREEIADYNFENLCRVTSSFGIIEIKHDETASAAFERCDSALYKAKNDGRNRIVVG